MTSPDPVICVKNISKSFNHKKVVKNLSLDLYSGRIVGFLGPNGSGKTTTIRMLCGLIKPDDGQGYCLGYNIFENPDPIREKIGYMTQKFSYWEDLTVKENLEFVASVYRIKKSKDLVDKTLESIGLQHRSNQLVGSLSGGWKQRLALAACTLHQPQILLLDEPTAGVDPKARREFWDHIHQFADQGLTILVSTHYMDEAERCHDIVYIAYGDLITQGTPAKIVKQSRLHTLKVEGHRLGILQKFLETYPDLIIAPFGSSLHITSHMLIDLEKYCPEHVRSGVTACYEIDPSMEDVFIYYLNERKTQ